MNTPHTTISPGATSAASSNGRELGARLIVAGLNHGFETDDGVQTALFSSLNFSVGTGRDRFDRRPQRCRQKHAVQSHLGFAHRAGGPH